MFDISAFGGPEERDQLARCGKLRWYDVLEGEGDSWEAQLIRGFVKHQDTYWHHYVHAKLLAQGVRVFRPSSEQIEAMKQVEIRLTLGEYRQPFPAMVVEYMDGFSISYLDKDYKNGLIITSWIKDQVSCCFVMDTVKHLEWHIEELPEAHRLHTRLALNCCLLLTHAGIRTSIDQRSHDLFRSWSKCPNPNKRNKGERGLREEIIHVCLDQDIQVMQRQAQAQEAGDGTGPKRRPHWRRGHWRNQAFGTGWLQHRLVFVPPMLIHAEEFGKRTNTIVYHG